MILMSVYNFFNLIFGFMLEHHQKNRSTRKEYYIGVKDVFL
jgi:hypothetical protein